MTDESKVTRDAILAGILWIILIAGLAVFATCQPQAF